MTRIDIIVSRCFNKLDEAGIALLVSEGIINPLIRVPVVARLIEVDFWMI